MVISIPIVRKTATARKWRTDLLSCLNVTGKKFDSGVNHGQVSDWNRLSRAARIWNISFSRQFRREFLAIFSSTTTEYLNMGRVVVWYCKKMKKKKKIQRHLTHFNFFYFSKFLLFSSFKSFNWMFVLRIKERGQTIY